MHRHHHHRHRRSAPSAPLVLARLRHHPHHHRHSGDFSMSTTAVTVVLPSTRTDGSALALTDIASCVLSKAVGTGAPAVAQTFTGPFTSASLSFTDSSPDFGQTDNYSAVVTDVEGNVSAAGVASVEVPPSQLAAPSAPSVTAVFTA
jgi:hypothetical protein